MACLDGSSHCISSGMVEGMSLMSLIPLPDFPPPPPIPSFMSGLIARDNLTQSCDLCSKWGDSSLLTSSSSSNLTFTLAMVAIISALSGAGIMAAILSIRRLRKRRSLHPDSMRHLERKCNEHNQTLPLPPSRMMSMSRSTNSTPLSMSNTYCEGPYTDNVGKEVAYPCNNIYAELHSSSGAHSAASASMSDIWRRPPIPVPPVGNFGMGQQDSCYLELRDLPGISSGMMNIMPITATTPLFSSPHQHGHGQCQGSQPQSPGTYSLSPSNTTTASYYTDLEVKNGRESQR